MTEKTTDEILQDIAENPKRVKGDSGELEEHSIPDIIALDKHRSAKAAARQRRFPGQFFKFRPPGAE